MTVQIFTVSQFVAVLNDIMRRSISPHEVGIEGEISDFRISQDKWIWFKLKDDESVIECFATVWTLKTQLEDGMKVRVFGYPRIHPKSGKFSINVERVELVGEGALRRAFELLKKKLEAEGLFAPERKRILSRFPEHIGLIASRESAAFTDFVRIINNRWTGLTIHLYHVSVQGSSAISEIVEAFDYFSKSQITSTKSQINSKFQIPNSNLDAIVLIRGGGSLEDLQAFNSEEIARAIFASKIPVLVGVGHERDETVADYVADVRASTPSNAAELLVPDKREIRYTMQVMVERLRDRMDYALESEKGRVIDAAGLLVQFAQRKSERVGEVARLLADRFMVALGRASERIGFALRTLDNLNPSKLLARGYSVVFKDGHVVRSKHEIATGDQVNVRLGQGSFGSTITDVTP